MKLSPLLIGAISAQSGDDADRWDATDFSLTDDIFTYEQAKPQQGKFDQATCTGTYGNLVIQAVTCWESNHMGNLDHYVTTNDDGFGWKNIHHGHDQGGHDTRKTNGTRPGVRPSTKYGATVASTSPAYQIGTYSRGMVPDGSSSTDSGGVVSTAVNRIDYHSAMAFDNRYSGCIYEAAGWDYNASTYNKMWRMSYGYDPARILASDATAAVQNDASGIDKSNAAVYIRPNWWHYFNSHILNVGMFDNNFDSYGRHLLVMANPAYEGLGFLNWITTFAKYRPSTDDEATETHAEYMAGGKASIRSDNLDGWMNTDANHGFVSSTAEDSRSATVRTENTVATGADESHYSEGRFRGMINHNTQNTVTDLFSGGYAFHLGTNCQSDAAAKAYTDNTYDTAAGVTQYMNPSIRLDTATATATRAVNAGNANAATTANGEFHWAGRNYSGYAPYQDGTGAPPIEVGEWYSYLMSTSAAMTDTALNPHVDSSAGNPAYGATLFPWFTMAAVSSFPHNDLGQDFRFNIRILHYGGRGFPYYFGGNNAGALTLAADGGTQGVVPTGLAQGTVSATTDFSIFNSQIRYLAQDSYYWYKVNTVQISFPSYVRCPRYPKNILMDQQAAQANNGQTDTEFKTNGTHTITDGGLGGTLAREERLLDTFRCMDSGNFNGHRGWDSSIPYNHETADTYNDSIYLGYSLTNNHRPTENYPYYLEQLTENDGSEYQGLIVSHNQDHAATATADLTGGGTPVYDNEHGFICGPVPPFNHAGTPGRELDNRDYRGEWYKCGQKYMVHGLMNTYDEHAQLEYGTMQEIWFQFWYHYVINFTTAEDGTGLPNEGFYDKRDSNTHRAANAVDNVATNNPKYHDNTHGDVFFTKENYKNNYVHGLVADTRVRITYDHLHNFPNILFNAFELRGIRFYCDKINSFNSNTCFHDGRETPAVGAFNPFSGAAAEIIGDSMLSP